MTSSIFHKFHPRLRHEIVNRLGWQTLRPVQEMAGAAILDGRNVVALAPTAGGKTEAAFFPVLSDILQRPADGVKCIYVSPLRALLNNQEDRVKKYTGMVGLSCFKWHGEARRARKRAFIKEPADILMTTPESLEVMLISPRIPANRLFENLRAVIIDEIHALAACDRGAHLLAALERIRVYAREDFQRVGLSATVGNPGEILNWARGSSQREGRVIDPPRIPTKKRVEIKYLPEFQVPGAAAQRARNRKTLFFCNSRALTEKIAKSMAPRRIRVFVHHSSISREERQEAEEFLARGADACVLCTSTLELGIDVGELDAVFQAEAPGSVSSFLQRLGRTGRRENSKMNAVFFTTGPEALLRAISLVELAKSHWVESAPLNNRCWHILVHQLMALCLQYGAVTRSRAWEILSNASCFRGIGKEEHHALIDYLIRKNFLFEESGRLSMGVEAEKKFGPKNFMELYSVFSSVKSFDVKTIGGRLIGTVENDFAETLEKESCFLLAGAAWVVKRMERAGSVIWVKKAAAGKTPTWGGFAPQLSGYELCRKMYDMIAGDAGCPYCDGPAKEELDAVREDKPLFRGRFAPFEIEGAHIFWWTYAGGKINAALKHALAFLTGRDVVANNYYIKIKGGRETAESFTERIQQMREDGFWENAELRGRLIEALPKTRLSKFQVCLPPARRVELLAKEFLDIAGAQRFLDRLME
ncbi:MAG: DEAD/DEAH box helicase [Desulfobacterales bacterium]|nr:DEAD/DEAH box helicase [Desulfobacterales bacterium]